MENQKKDEKKKKKGLFYVLSHSKNGKKSGVLILALFLTIVMATTATYAWFTANYTVSVTKLDVTVASGAGIQISTDAINWKSLVTSEELATAYTNYPKAVNQVPTQTNTNATLSPVSTIKSIDTISGTTNASTSQSIQGLTMYLGNVTSNVNGDYILSTTKQTDTNGKTGHYLAFDVFIKSDFTSEVDLYLTKATSVHGVSTNDKDIEYASRIAIIDEGYVAASASTADMQALNAGTSVKFIEPNFDVHTQTGVNHAHDVYGIETTTGPTTIVGYSGVKAAIPTDAVDYDTTQATGVKWGDATAANYSDYFSEVTIDYPISSTNDTSETGTRNKLMTLHPGVTKLRLYMWIEGQDIDCENNASGGSILFNIGFEVDEPTAGGTE